MLLYNKLLGVGYMHIIKLFLLSLCFGSLLPITTQAAEIKLLTSIKPLQLIAAAIQKDIGKPEVLLPAGASAHHYSLRPSDIQNVQSADLFYWIGQDMEVFLVKTLTNRQKPTIAIQNLPDIQLRHFGDHHEAHDDHDHEHQAGSIDSHLWLSPTNAKAIANKMAADLIQLDPNNKTRYQQNLQEFNETLAAMDKNIRHHLADTRLKPFFVFHETYDYFENAYNIKHAGVFSIYSGVQPGVKHVSEMQAQLKAAGPSCIFYEPPTKPKLAETLTANLPVQVLMLDAMGAELPVTAQGYPMLLNALMTEFLKCQVEG